MLLSQYTIFMKASHREQVKKLTDIPNIGEAMASDFLLLGITSPDALKDKDPYHLYMKLTKITGKRQDPCVLDTYMSAIDFMNGAPRRPWYYYTEQRKAHYGKLLLQ